mmetsp:Transcript_1626/g.4769  ORF Transcript_1626/g.4769 Transcript_1626/m.4769 type:complete len:217 (+) Transcript_1626:169-819(+)|eukprot:CAMPEP_0206146914 /NCGR_PEP_ID=MMETSP1473-20131121/31773_1 /ASSEMBLY_ACC=CAM_ASM_001109 /TAXON_ID=1461547 /ORGANISM="Stichococcus sp, Strain RCC1054" /LENGTH=216 /DNA_ID=CAMNT_0053543641 /DNA_START=82 /DNA_END=732 /DNA_ORIENTATION=-
MDTLGPAIYSAAGKAVGICQGACYAAAALFRKAEPAAPDAPGGSTEGSPGKKRRTGEAAPADGSKEPDSQAPPPAAEPQENGGNKKAEEQLKEATAEEDVAKPASAQEATTQLNVEAPPFEPKAADETEAAPADPTPAEAFGVSEEVAAQDSTAAAVDTTPPGNETYAEAVVEEPEEAAQEEVPAAATTSATENGSTGSEGGKKKSRSKKRKGGGK